MVHTSAGSSPCRLRTKDSTQTQGLTQEISSWAAQEQQAPGSSKGVQAADELAGEIYTVSRSRLGQPSCNWAKWMTYCIRL